MSEMPIGIFDSGLGGISLLREAVSILPNENYIFYGDNLHAPYGDKTDDEIAKLSFDSVNYLVSKGVKAVVLACNTATAASIRALRDDKRLDLPIISLEPAIKPACEKPGDGKILMMATLATTRLKRYKALQSRMPDPSRVINVPCPGLVEMVERGTFAPEAYYDILYKLLNKYNGMKIDGIVLGCTHYIFIKSAIERYAKSNFKGECAFYDGNAATVRQLGRVLEANGLTNLNGNASVEFCTSGDRSKIYPIFELLMNHKENQSVKEEN